MKPKLIPADYLRDNPNLVLPIYPCLEYYGKVKALLEAQGQRIDDFDLLIGVTALQNQFTMVTANVKHLGRIPNLNVVNWE